MPKKDFLTDFAKDPAGHTNSAQYYKKHKENFENELFEDNIALMTMEALVKPLQAAIFMLIGMQKKYNHLSKNYLKDIIYKKIIYSKYFSIKNCLRIII
jgi:CRISPR/Cas system Type II protein with McrA/HNH and RuvC-like nuclease domain